MSAVGEDNSGTLIFSRRKENLNVKIKTNR